jgi:Ca-activated chloride channel family protein
MISFVWPWAFLLLPLPYLVRKLAPAAPEPRAGSLRVPFFRAVASFHRGRHGNAVQRRSYLVAMVIAWLALVTATARPTWHGKPSPVPVDGRDLLLATDISGSMARDDLTLGGHTADRLTVVKEVADDFLSRRQGDRIGLILFGTRAYLQSPLTFDRDTVRALLGEAEIGLAGEETAIGDAIGLATKRLRDRPSDDRVLVLLTDGASNAGALDPIEAARIAAAEKIRIYTVGVGADRVAMQTAFGTRIVNPSADLDEKTLAEIADLTGGQYFRAKNVEALADVYREIDRIEPVAGEPRHVRPERQLFAWPLGLAVALSLFIAGAELAPWSAIRWPKSTPTGTEVTR